MDRSTIFHIGKPSIDSLPVDINLRLNFQGSVLLSKVSDLLERQAAVRRLHRAELVCGGARGPAPNQLCQPVGLAVAPVTRWGWPGGEKWKNVVGFFEDLGKSLEILYNLYNLYNLKNLWFLPGLGFCVGIQFLLGIG